MILIATSLALLAIVAGMNLLIKTKKEALGNFFKYVSYFVVLVGFLSLICVGTRSVIGYCNQGGGNCNMSQWDGMDGKCMNHCMGGEKMDCKEEMMMGAKCKEMMNDSTCKMKKMDCQSKMQKKDSTGIEK